MIKHKGNLYRVAQPVAVIDDAYWRHAALKFWISAVVESGGSGDSLPAKSKRLTAATWAKIPEPIRTGVGHDVDVQQRILAAIDRNACHYINIDFAGWEPGVRGGTKEVQLVQSTLEWIEQFRTRPTLGGNTLIWAEYGSQVKRR
ncbi:hypothetical protein LCGC14_0468760 [marine sediment metagenome]|uniref:Uncharacterized protein n=1 Tax=marine sediment metagenome TaxID=412755 RepID=A0A0F9SCS5_9ZZZZ